MGDPTEQTVGEAMRQDIDRWRALRLHWLVIGVLFPTFAITTIGITGFSAAFAAVMTFEGLIEHFTVNASWFFVSLYALVGLFVAYPAHKQQDGSKMLGQSRPVLVGTLFSRWLLVGGSVLLSFVVPVLLAIVAFDSVSLLPALGFAFLTALCLMAYVAIGLTLGTLIESNNRFVLSLLVAYWVLAHLWDTSLIPLIAAIAVTGDPEGAIGTPPQIHDILLAMSPSGAYATLSNAVVSGGLDTLSIVALLALSGWLMLPLLLVILVRSLVN